MVKYDRFKVFLYYKDLEGAKRFYREILGMPEHKESEYVWQYEVTPDSLIGLVADGHGYIPASDDKPVMPAIHVDPKDYADAGPVVGSEDREPCGWSHEYDVEYLVTGIYRLYIQYANAASRPTCITFDTRHVTK